MPTDQYVASGSNSNIMNRAVAVLSDGTVIICEYDATSDTFRFYHSADRDTWTNPINYVDPGGAYVPIGASIAIDASNNIHLVWSVQIDAPGNCALYYRKYTKAAGYTWTAGTAETVYVTTPNVPSPGSRNVGRTYIGRCDITALNATGTSVAVVYHGHEPDAGNWNYIGVRARNTGGTWAWVLGTDSVLYGQSNGSAIAFTQGWVSICSDPLLDNRVLVAAWGANNVNTTSAVGTITVATGVQSGSFTYLSGVSGVSDDDVGIILPMRDTSYWNWQWVSTKSHQTQVGVMYVKASAVANGSMYWGGYTKSAGLKGLPATNLTGDYLVVLAYRAAGGANAYTFAPFIGWKGPFRFSASATTMYYLSAGATRNVTTKADFRVGPAGTGARYLAYNNVPGVPTTIIPAAGSTVQTDRPLLSATGPTMETTDWLLRGEWQIADDAGFTTNLRTVTEIGTDLHSDKKLSEQMALANELTGQGTKYIRARAYDALGVVGAWSASQTFTVAHAPGTTNYSPSGGIVLSYGVSGTVTFDWDFTDTSPADSQTAYQVVVELNSDGSTVVDTGKVVSTATQHTLNIPIGSKNAVLRWKVRVWDNDDVVGSYSAYNLFTSSDPPTVAITAPAEASVQNNPQPAVTWTYTPVLARAQVRYRVKITYAPTSTLVYDSGWVVSAVASHTIPTPVLNNASSYVIEVDAEDTAGLVGVDTNTFTTVWVAPSGTAFTVDAATYQTNGYVRVQWTNASQDADFAFWRVYRRPTGGTWGIIYTTTTADAAYDYHDWTAGSGITYDYEVRQVANRFGAYVESAPGAYVTVTPTSDEYWLIHPDPAQESLNMRLPQVTSEDFSEEYEEETLALIGRGRHKDVGTRFGYTGSLSCEMWGTTTMTARGQRLQLEALKATKRELFLRNPFGDLWQVSPGAIQISRTAGVGLREMHTASIPYEEVA
jgi:hypothetical protein